MDSKLNAKFVQTNYQKINNQQYHQFLNAIINKDPLTYESRHIHQNAFIIILLNLLSEN